MYDSPIDISKIQKGRIRRSEIRRLDSVEVKRERNAQHWEQRERNIKRERYRNMEIGQIEKKSKERENVKNQ